jgi:hypothetical protein
MAKGGVEQGGTMKSTATPGLSRRGFLAGASAFGAVAIASAAAPPQTTTLAPFEKLPPYGNNTLPAGVNRGSCQTSTASP